MMQETIKAYTLRLNIAAGLEIDDLTQNEVSILSNTYGPDWAERLGYTEQGINIETYRTSSANLSQKASPLGLPCCSGVHTSEL